MSTSKCVTGSCLQRTHFGPAIQVTDYRVSCSPAESSFRFMPKSVQPMGPDPKPSPTKPSLKPCMSQKDQPFPLSKQLLCLVI